MKTNSNYNLRTICGENVLVAEGSSAINMSSIISLNDSAAYLWKNVIGKEFTADDLRDLLLEEYEVDPETAATDAKALIQSWREMGLVTE